jgi:ferredoxin
MDKQTLDPKFAKFHGIDRDKIDWHPKIDESKCVGCGLCVTSCGRGVYKFDYENKKSKVAILQITVWWHAKPVPISALWEQLNLPKTMIQEKKHKK